MIPLYIKRVLRVYILLCLAPCYAAAEIAFYYEEPGLGEVLKTGHATTISEATNYLLLSKIGIPREILTVPTRRILRIIKGKKPACTFSKLKTRKRLKYAIFSKPIDIYQGRLLYQFKDDEPISAHWLNKDGELISLSEYFSATPRATLMLSDAMSFSDYFDSEIKKIAAHQKVVRFSSESYEAFFQMFFERKADFILMYPEFVSNFFSGKDADLLRSYRVAGSDLFESGHLMCSDTSSTRAYIAEADQALRNLYLSPEFLQAHLKHLPASGHEQFVKLYQEVFLPYITHTLSSEVK